MSSERYVPFTVAADALECVAAEGTHGWPVARGERADAARERGDAQRRAVE